MDWKLAKRILDYRTAHPSAAKWSATVSGWASLLLASLIKPIDINEVGQTLELITVVLALVSGIYAVWASRGRSVPGWGGLIVTVATFIGGGLYTFS